MFPRRLIRPVLLGRKGLDTFIESLGPSFYFKHEETSGTAIVEAINGYNGTYAGVDLAQDKEPFTCPYFDRVNDYGDIKTAQMVAAADVNKGSFVQFVKPVDAAYISTIGILGATLNLVFVNGNNIISAGKIGAAYYLKYVGAAVGKTLSVPFLDAWFQVGGTWDTTADEVKYFHNGAQYGSTLDTLTAPVGSMTVATVGAADTTPTNVWDGWLAHTAIWFGDVLTEDEYEEMYTRSEI